VSPSITIDHVTLRGDAIGRLDELEVSVPGLFDAEVARVEIVHTSKHKKAASARVLELLAPHPARRIAPCPRHEARAGLCGGCALMELDEPAQLDVKKRMLAALGLSVDRVVSASPPLGYRMSSKRVAFRAKNGALALGSWAKNSHVGADMEGCLVEHPRIREAASELVRAANAAGIDAYDEANDRGDLRYVWLKTDGDRVTVTLVTAREESRATTLASRLTIPSGVAHSVQSARTNVMRGTEPRVLSGSLAIDALGFAQPNRALIDRAYEEILDGETGDLALDLYAGAGAITTRLRTKFARVTPCERYPESAAALGVAPMDVDVFLDTQLERPDLIVANPPRKGLGESVCAKIAALHPPRLAIMSCGPEGLVRDLAALERAGYRCASLTAYDSLPQTPHVEIVAKLAPR
jgi:23S rRNA (uracil1939-C5)-methyltransferase